MRVTYIAAGAGGSYCGACARDLTLVRGLMARGHDVTMTTLYTPIRAEGDDPSFDHIFYGGISVYLAQKTPWLRWARGGLGWLLDRPSLLRLVSKHAIETRPEQLGPLTVSVLRGPEGFQRKELGELVQFLQDVAQPNVVNLTNSLLSGLAATIKERLGTPVVCTLQGADAFVQRLGEPYANEARALMRDHAQAIDAFVSPCEQDAARMAAFLDVAPERIRVIRQGIDTSAFAPAPSLPREPFRVGYLSRISPIKGLDLLAEAAERLADDPAVTVAVAGQVAPQNRAFWRAQQCRLGDRLEYWGEPDLSGKLEFFHRCSLFCLPSRYAEPRGTAALEAMAAGVPALVPNHGAFPEIVALTAGGVLFPPGDASALAEALDRLRRDPDGVALLGRRARAGIEQHFSAEQMVSQTEALYAHVLC